MISSPEEIAYLNKWISVKQLKILANKYNNKYGEYLKNICNKTRYINCKITNKKIPILFDFGNMPIANSFSKFVSNKNFYKMKVAFNEQNGVFQLVSAPAKTNVSRKLCFFIFNI